jgi:hypothetical protein
MSIKTKKPRCPIWAARPGSSRCLRLRLVQKQAQCLSPKRHRRRKIRRAPNLWIFFLLKRTLAHSTPRARNTSEGGLWVAANGIGAVHELLGLPMVLRSGSAGAEENATLPPGGLRAHPLARSRRCAPSEQRATAHGARSTALRRRQNSRRERCRLHVQQRSVLRLSVAHGPRHHNQSA